MDSSIINGLFTIVGVLIGGVISYLTAKDTKEINSLNHKIEELQEKNDALKKDIVVLCNQITSYWNIEKAYSEEVAALTNKKQKNILKMRRDAIVSKGVERPNMTSEGARKILAKL